IDQRRHAGQLIVLLENGMKQWIIFAPNYLWPRRSVHMYCSGCFAFHELRTVAGYGHKPRRRKTLVDVMVSFSPVLVERDRRKGHEFRAAEPLVQPVIHVGIRGKEQNRPVTERTWSVFQRAVESRHDFSTCENLRYILGHIGRT